MVGLVCPLTTAVDVVVLGGPSVEREEFDAGTEQPSLKYTNVNLYITMDITMSSYVRLHLVLR